MRDIDNDNPDLEKVIQAADPYHGQGTKYLHTKKGTGNDKHNAKSGSIENPTGAVVVPISLATTFQQESPGKATAVDDPNSMGVGYEYSRTGNPTRGAFELAMVQAEQGAKYCVAFSSGSAATSAVMHLLKHGDHFLCIDDVYGGTQRYFRRILTPVSGIQVDFVDMDNTADLSFKENTKLVWLESPTNPTLKITDIQKIAQKCHEHNCLLAVDNTFCSPYFQSPLLLGADLVVHSVTKYIGGHSDVVMGVVACSDSELYKQLRFVQNGVGAVPSPFDCFLAHRGLKTLHVRMEAAARNAMAVALFLKDHPAVESVAYPGLKSHPQHELAKRQQHGYGAMVSFSCVGGRAEAAVFLKNLRVFCLAESLGAVESLAESPSLMTHASLPDHQRSLLGIDDSFIRLSCGIESCHDLVEDLRVALDAVEDSMNGTGKDRSTSKRQKC